MRTVRACGHLHAVGLGVNGAGGGGMRKGLRRLPARTVPKRASHGSTHQSSALADPMTTVAMVTRGSQSGLGSIDRVSSRHWQFRRICYQFISVSRA